MATMIGQQLRAWGRYPLPERIRVKGEVYRFGRVFKHDFFAATLLYIRMGTSDNAGIEPGDGSLSEQQAAPAKKVVLKLGRRSDFLGVPLQWLGEALCTHEMRMLQELEGIRGVPKILCGYGKIGFVYEYIEGVSLDEKPVLPDDFFDRLSELLKEIHARHLAYLDMNKRGNILLGAEGRPYMIDFQIACRISERFLGSRRWSRKLAGTLQKEDFYHLGKHKRRLRADLMSEQELSQSRRVSWWIMMHRRIIRPLTHFRRSVLGWLLDSGQLITDDISQRSRETNPERWKKNSKNDREKMARAESSGGDFEEKPLSRG